MFIFMLNKFKQYLLSMPTFKWESGDINADLNKNNRIVNLLNKGIIFQDNIFQTSGT